MEKKLKKYNELTADELYDIRNCVWTYSSSSRTAPITN